MATAANDTSPLLPQHTSQTGSPSRPGLQKARTVTFNPKTSVSTQSGATSSGSLRPMQSPSAALGASTGAKREQQPMLSALNSKLRRRNSHGAPLPTTQPFTPAPRLGAQRTTKTTEKLKILPNPDIGEEDEDEESGRDVYAQFTRIKDPTARRDAARLGRADRDKLPRVTAYCVAQGYRLEGIMKFMKSRARTRGANPKLFDECLYSPYDYDYTKKSDKNKVDDLSSSPVQERIARVMASPRIAPGERRYSDSAVEVEDNKKQRRDDLIDFQEQEELEPSALGTDTNELALAPTQSDTDLDHSEGQSQHQRSNSEFSTTVHTPEIFIFDYGTVVIWGMTVQQEQRFLNDMSKFSDAPLPTESVQTENFNFYYTKEYQARIYNDFISLREPRNHMIKLAISHALSQSVKTSLFEDLVSETIDATSPLPALIAQTGSVNLTRRQLNMQIGELFILRINIHLQGSVLDSPELMWAEPHLEPVYAAVRSYLEIEQRVGLLTERLDVIADLLAVLREQGSRRHGEVLEWIVIVLIAAEILVAAINIVVDLYAGVD
ncbi:sporulation protein rmd1 [Elasticomyces elasticus]|uniref:Sporulation protein rmd1 n=1 Tax=Exophiala sideris TaxID=1016849 RepID=A0A0D1Z0W2_9EURO|nr:sporulation protein rmd1 [Elasticomyces elasticus]KAK5026622.1 sporulation protein rmd1 [Exophiala sideris]KAK5176453.1 sporulation protein rmd1 [Eurotiomycetes sp. CCFEE 6388]KAK5033638.1 sporulation protein rmd1 [Exophiala sideris]KAK5055461.1 sporulation protein rmd1 [Exophiala sideris]